MSLRSDGRASISGLATDGIVQSGRRMLAILVGMVRTRLNILAIELMEEKSRIWLMAVLTVLALICGMMALLTLSLLVIVVFWDESRMLAIGGVLAFYVVATAASLFFLWRKAKMGSSLFTGTLGELAKDSEALEDAIEDRDVFEHRNRDG